MKKLAYIILIIFAGTIFMSSQVIPQKRKKNMVPQEFSNASPSFRA